MKHRHARIVGRSRGQATVEFVLALLVMVPLFFGVFYFARYADVKHSAIQASRYVAFERALDPHFRAKTQAQLADETRARFFQPISADAGRITSQHGRRRRSTTAGGSGKGPSRRQG